jgi:hypothetical protein
MAVRAEVGRLPLPRLPGWRRSGAAVEGLPAAGPLLPGARGDDRVSGLRAVRARRRDRHSRGRPSLVRRPPDAHPPGGEPHPQARTGHARDADPVRSAGGWRREFAGRAPPPGAARAVGGLLHASGAPGGAGAALPGHNGSAPRTRVVCRRGREPRRDPREAAGRTLPLRGSAEGCRRSRRSAPPSV